MIKIMIMTTVLMTMTMMMMTMMLTVFNDLEDELDATRLNTTPWLPAGWYQAQVSSRRRPDKRHENIPTLLLQPMQFTQLSSTLYYDGRRLAKL